MYSVTQRISQIKQPRGGYINRKDFTCITLEDGIELNAQENIHPGLIGLAIDYMTRFCMGSPKESAFRISLHGAKIAKNEFDAYKLLSKIKGLDTESIINASKLVGYDVCYRAGMASYKPVSEINPDMNTVTNIITMIKRTLSFWNQYGPIIKDGFTFEGGYTSIISKGDGDYLTKDTLWDLKVSKKEIKPEYTLQLLIYYIMGQHSIHKEFDNITQLGIYNPRLNKIYIIKLDTIPQSIIDTVSQDVIGYGISKEKLENLQTVQLEGCKKKSRKSSIQKRTPNANDITDYLDPQIYGYSSKKKYMSVAFPPKINDESIYEKDPVFWSGNALPSIIAEKNLSYIVRFKACFNIKNEEEPFVINKTDFRYPLNKALTTSDIYDSKSQKYYSHYLDCNGNLVKSRPTLILTRNDFKLFQKLYSVKDLEILDGCYFYNNNSDYPIKL